ncbi:MAG: DUF2236 domain-containing protein [Acidobacteria bacterium]|nr:DUF2236 domain-containing protein [Acidobacteriota bacterium]
MSISAARQPGSPLFAGRRAPAGISPDPVRVNYTGLDFDAAMEWVRARSEGGADGIFGPGSAMWMVMREPAVEANLLAPLTILHLSHPGAGGDRDWVRRTLEDIRQILFSGMDGAAAAARRVREQGGGTVRLKWLLSALTVVSVRQFEKGARRFRGNELARYYEDIKKLGVAIGIPYQEWPAFWSGLLDGFLGAIENEALETSEAARELVHSLMKRGPTPLGFLPGEILKMYGVRWDLAARLRFEMAVLAGRMSGFRASLTTP